MTEKEEFKKKLKEMTDHDLYESCKKYIWLSAYAANNPRSAYHWMCDYCYDESTNRGKPKVYSDAYRVTYMSNGGSDPHPEDGALIKW
jgi:hypothetical protein